MTVSRCLLSALFTILVITSCWNNNPSPTKNGNDEVDSTQITGSENNADLAPDLILGKDREPGNVNKRLHEELDSNDIYNDKVLAGFWFKPHEAADVNIFFHKNGQFEMKYYVVQSKTDIKEIYRTGKYEQSGESVTLKADDGWMLKVHYGRRDNPEDTNFYITKDKFEGGELYLVKGSL